MGDLLFHPTRDPLATHGRQRLPRGWLLQEGALYAEGPEGFVAVARSAPGHDVAEPPLLGWGRDRLEARAAAARRRADQATILTVPCTSMLRDDVRTESASSCVLSEEGVAYSHAEPSPEEIVEDWLEHAVLPAHGIMAAANEGWDEAIPLIDLMARAYLRGHPAVGMTGDGRLGWTEAAPRRGEAEAGGVSPLAMDLAEARAEVRANFPDPMSARRWRGLSQA